jgi:peptide/nickel transport system permease protein
MLLTRLVWVIPSLLVVAFFVFGVLALAPGDTARTIAGPDADAEAVSAVRRELGLDRPLVSQYASWVADASHGDLQKSLVGNRPVRDLITAALPATVSLTLIALVLAAVLGLLLGIIPSLWRRSWVDRICSLIAAACLSAPTFWIALILASTFGVDRRWFPALGYVGITESPVEWIHHLILPALALAAPMIGELSRQMRGALVAVLQSDYALAARAKGMSNPRVVVKHSLKNAAVPVVTVLGVRIAQMLGGTVIIEQIFVIKGLGRLTINSVLSRDVPVILGIVVVSTAIVLVVNLVVDASYPYFNPRARTT